jgi:hypothetical protein
MQFNETSSCEMRKLGMAQVVVGWKSCFFTIECACLKVFEKD